MWNLSPAVFQNYREHLDIAFPLANADPDVTEAAKAQILDLYELYEQTKGRPNQALQGVELSAALKDKIKSAYQLVQNGRRLSDLRDALKLISHICPYCGYGAVLELDHFLQKAHYELLSIFALNLVPSCADCNRGKRKVPSINPAEHQVHVYLEDVSGYDFFRANVRLDVQSGALDVVFYVQQCPGMSLDLFHRLQNHLVEFNLQERYAKQVNTFLAPLKTSFDMVFAAHGAIGVKNFLAKTAASLEVKWGINDWHVALIRGLEVSDEFCQGGFEHALGY